MVLTFRAIVVTHEDVVYNTSKSWFPINPDLHDMFTSVWRKVTSFSRYDVLVENCALCFVHDNIHILFLSVSSALLSREIIKLL